MKTYNVGILGASGAVGREMLKILAERNFPIGELRLLASAKSVGKKLTYMEKNMLSRKPRMTLLKAWISFLVLPPILSPFVLRIALSKPVLYSSIILPLSVWMKILLLSFQKSTQRISLNTMVSFPIQTVLPSSL